MSAQWVGSLASGWCPGALSLQPTHPLLPSSSPSPLSSACTLPIPTLCFREPPGCSPGVPPLFWGALLGHSRPGGLCLPCPQADQSGILHEIHQPRHEPEEDPLQKAERRLRCEDQCGDQVGTTSGVPASPALQGPHSMSVTPAITLHFISHSGHSDGQKWPAEGCSLPHTML